MTVIEYSPEHKQAEEYRVLARKIGRQQDVRGAQAAADGGTGGLLMEFGIIQDDDPNVGVAKTASA